MPLLDFRCTTQVLRAVFLLFCLQFMGRILMSFPFGHTPRPIPLGVCAKVTSGLLILLAIEFIEGETRVPGRAVHRGNNIAVTVGDGLLRLDLLDGTCIQQHLVSTYSLTENPSYTIRRPADGWADTVDPKLRFAILVEVNRFSDKIPCIPIWLKLDKLSVFAFHQLLDYFCRHLHSSTVLSQGWLRR